MKYFLPILGLFLLITACNTSKPSTSTTPDLVVPSYPEEEVEDFPDTALEPQTTGPYQPSAKRTHDLIHTSLDLSFDWNNQQVIGTAILTIKPYFYPTTDLTLDAKGFTLQQVSLAASGQPLSYTYDNNKIYIQLNRSYTRNDTFNILINYIASPSSTGGSAAITDNKGLYFINPDGSDPNKPRQIWTQGETNWNSRWFPTIDHPNERCTQDLSLTVDNRFKTLSNGLLVSSKNNPDGTRTDRWKLDQPHAPYLFMIAVGEYAVVEDTWRNIPLAYYVEPEFEADARHIFPYTPEMLELFSNQLGVTYPWPKYAQVVVRDFVSGAMENTTAVIFGEFIQKHKEDLIDDRSNEKIVAHEMMHHWFGDYVTCESWANLTLNEGFANYSEYLWLEHKYGREEADYHLLEEWDGYFNQAAESIHPLIHFNYADNEDMFDAHSYNKGGAVLHMLRHYTGDEAFFAALQLFIEKNAYQPVEVHDLRLAFESVTGEDLNWFFNQWFLSAGHPNLDFSYQYNEETGKLLVSIEQSQDPELMPATFDIPTEIDIYAADGSKTREKIRLTDRFQSYEFDIPTTPQLVILDPQKVLLCERNEPEKTNEEYFFQYDHAPSLLDRLNALEKILEIESDEILAVFNKGLDDPFWLIRAVSIGYADFEEESIINKIRLLAKSDPHSTVRQQALDNLSNWEDEQAPAIAQYILEKDSVSALLSIALNIIASNDPESALQYAAKLENSTNDEVIVVIADLYSTSENADYLPFFEKQISKADGFLAINLFTAYNTLLLKTANTDNIIASANAIASVAKNDQSLWRKFAAAKFLVDTANYLLSTNTADNQNGIQQEAQKLLGIVKSIRDNETDEDMKGIYNQLLGEQ
jgi:aminopeptidase N